MIELYIYSFSVLTASRHRLLSYSILKSTKIRFYSMAYFGIFSGEFWFLVSFSYISNSIVLIACNN